MTRFLVFALLLALVSYWLHRRLVRATGVARPWSIIVDIFLGLLWVLAMIGVGSGVRRSGGDHVSAPAPARRDTKVITIMASAPA